VLVDSSKKILKITYHETQCHDFKLFKLSRLSFSNAHFLLADSGYQGIKKLVRTAVIPIKKPKGGALTATNKAYNRWVSRQRIGVENVFARLKVFKVIGSRYRNHLRRLNLRFNLIAGIYNFELKV
jgi:transposase